MKISYKTLFVALCLMLMTMAFVWAIPTAPDTISKISDQRISPTPPFNTQALAGNVTLMNIDARSITRFWQGYYGNITGTIVLGDADNFTMYQWAMASPHGEIYATHNTTATINWSNLGCIVNETLVQEELWLGTNQTGADVDDVNYTFDRYDHPSFYTGPLSFRNCRTTSVNGTGNGIMFWEVLLQDNGTDPAVTTDDVVIYTSLIDQDRMGFDARTHDFQLLVGEPGAGTQSWPYGTITNYYFYVELE